MSRKRLVRLLLPLLLTGAAVDGGRADEPLLIYTVNYPLKYFADRIGGGRVRTEFPAPAGVDPAFWKPDVEDILGYQGADAVLLNGANYARWLGMASLPRSKLVDTSSAFRADYLPALGGSTHSHGPTGSHSHAGTAFTTWLDFRQASLQAGAVAAAMIARSPGAQAAFEQGLEALEADLAALDAALEDIVGNGRDTPLVASHPVYQYLARRYRLNLESVLWEPEQAPTDAQWAELRAILRTHPARWMIWESVPAPRTVAMLAELGVSSLVFDPGANVPDSGDWLDLMRRNLENIEPAFR